MDSLRAAISPQCIHWDTFRAGANTQYVRGQSRSCFLEYMYFEWAPDADGIICDFFHSKGRAHEYYLGKPVAHLMKPMLTRKSNMNSSSTPVSSRSAAITKRIRVASMKNAPSIPPASKPKLTSSRKRMKTDESIPTGSTGVAEPAKTVWLSRSRAMSSSSSTQTTLLHQTAPLMQIQQAEHVDPPKHMEVSLTGRPSTFLAGSAPECLPLSKKVITVSTAQPLAPRLVVIPPGVSAVISMEDLFAEKEEEEEEEDWELVPTAIPDIQHLRPQYKQPSSTTLSLRTRFSVRLQRLRPKKST